jgi:hypothetical protein
VADLERSAKKSSHAFVCIFQIEHSYLDVRISVSPAGPRDGGADVFHFQAWLFVLRAHSDGRKEDRACEVSLLVLFARRDGPDVCRVIDFWIMVMKKEPNQ